MDYRFFLLTPRILMTLCFLPKIVLKRLKSPSSNSSVITTSTSSAGVDTKTLSTKTAKRQSVNTTV